MEVVFGRLPIQPSKTGLSREVVIYDRSVNIEDRNQESDLSRQVVVQHRWSLKTLCKCSISSCHYQRKSKTFVVFTLHQVIFFQVTFPAAIETALIVIVS